MNIYDLVITLTLFVIAITTLIIAFCAIALFFSINKQENTQKQPKHAKKTFINTLFKKNKPTISEIDTKLQKQIENLFNYEGDSTGQKEVE